MKRSVLNFLTFILLLLPQLAFGASNEIDAAVQKGLFEEEANHNVSEAIAAYQSAIAHFEDARSLAATAVFRLGEVYRKLGKTNEANLQYQRIPREFSDQSDFAGLSRSYLGASGKVEGAYGSTNAPTDNPLAGEEQEIRRLQKLIAESPDLLNAPDPISGQTPLFSAVLQGQLAVAQFLITNSADVNAKDRGGMTPLYAAVGANRKEMVELLLRSKADPNITSGTDRNTPLHVACQRALKPIVESLLAGGANPNIRNAHYVAPLHLAAASGFKTIVEVLLANKADANNQGGSFEVGTERLSGTPLEIAIIRGYPAIAELLLLKGVDPNKSTTGGGTALHAAVSYHRSEIVDGDVIEVSEKQ